MKNFFLLIITLSIVHISEAQTFSVTPIANNSATTLKNLINNNFLGQGISLIGNPTHIAFNNNTQQLGSFANAPAAFKMVNGGILLSSGKVADIAGSTNPNTSMNPVSPPPPFSDLNINNIVQKYLSAPYFSSPQCPSDCGYDKSVLEFDFAACGDTVSFNYLFASSEYGLYTCSQYTDFFGFFISGPNPNGGTYNNVNVAIIPKDTSFTLYDSLPVMINSINGGAPSVGYPGSQCASLAYASLFNGSPTSGFAFDRKTLKLKTKPIKIFPGQVYHIKIAIQDIGDGTLDSGVLLEAGSFTTSEPAEVVGLSTVGNNQAAVFEGCGEHRVKIKRKGNVTVKDTVFISYKPFPASTASIVPGVDLLLLPTFAEFPIGSDSVVIVYTAISDSISEIPFERLRMNFKIRNCVNGFDSVDYELRINDPAKVINLTVPVNIEEPCPNKSHTLSMSFISAATNGLTNQQTLKYTWKLNGSVIGNTRFITVNPPSPGTYKYFCTATDTCGTSATDSITLTKLPYNSIIATLPSVRKDCPKDTIILKASFNGGVPPYFVKTFANSSTDISYFGDFDTLFTLQDTLKFKIAPIATTDYLYIVRDFCFITNPNLKFNNIVKVGDGILPLFSDDLADSTVICEGNSFTLKINPTGGVKRYKYFWSTGNTKDSIITVTPGSNTKYFYRWTDRCEVDTLRDTILVKVSKVKSIFEASVPALQSGVPGDLLGNFDDTKFKNLSTTNDTSVSYQWFLNGSPISTDKDFKFNLDYDKDNTVRLVATNNRGCFSIYEKPIPSQTFINVPNVFTPNNDNINENFASINKGVVNYELKIYNRWGALVYETQEPKEGWNGSVNGVVAEGGTYFVVLKYNEKESTKESKYQGYVNLVR